MPTLEGRVKYLERRLRNLGVPAQMGPEKERLYRRIVQVILENEPEPEIKERMRAEFRILLLQRGVDLNLPEPEGGGTDVWDGEPQDLLRKVVDIILDNEPDSEIRHRMAVVLEEVVHSV